MQTSFVGTTGVISTIVRDANNWDNNFSSCPSHLDHLRNLETIIADILKYVIPHKPSFKTREYYY